MKTNQVAKRYKRYVRKYRVQSYPVAELERRFIERYNRIYTYPLMKPWNSK